MRTAWASASHRFEVWWERWKITIAFFSITIVSVVGFWSQHVNYTQLTRVVEQLEQTEARISAEREERTHALILQEATITRLEVETAKQIADQQLRIIRQANLDGCRRDNGLRMRLRSSVGVQLAVARSMGASAVPQLSLTEYIRLMNAQEATLARLHNELDQVDCDGAYPSVASP